MSKRVSAATRGRLSQEPPQRSIEDLWGPPMRRTLLLTTIVLGALASGCTIAVVEPSLTFGIPRIASVVAIAVWLLTPIEVAIWKAERIWSKHPAQKTVRRSAWGRLVFLPLIAVIGFLAHSSQVNDNLFTAGAVCFLLSRVHLGLRLRKLVPELPSIAVKDVGTTQTEKPKAKSATSDTAVAQAPVIGDCADRKIRSFRAGISRLLLQPRQIAAACLLVLCITVALVGIADGLGWATGKWSQQVSTRYHKKLKGKAGGQSTGNSPKEGGTNKGTGGAGEPEDPTRCSVSPQSGIPPQVIEEFQALYAGTHQLGTAQTGCPREIYEESTPEGVLYWALGKLPGDRDPTSLAVIPPTRFHSMLVLWPAVTPVEQIIKRGENVGGPRRFPRYYVGGGDCYLINTEHGTVVLVQEETGTASQGRPLVQMPVSASFAWLSLTNETKVWRWPIELQSSGDAKVFGLKQTGDPISHYRIEYNSNGTATRNAESGMPGEYTASETQINPAELLRWAPLATTKEREREEEEETPQERREREAARSATL
jgi:hypothetical protein